MVMYKRLRLMPDSFKEVDNYKKGLKLYKTRRPRRDKGIKDWRSYLK